MFAVAHTVQIDAGEEITTQICEKIFKTREAAQIHITKEYHEWYEEFGSEKPPQLSWQGDTATDPNSDIVSFWQIEEVAL